ncbi:uncharacterized protein LOC129581315 isoform X2 [Paramacrobiotus metropolitanus]|uniref:uncharacterized protein LOC129581315 isoform X2 n=1 Tax=Paramacrobiotus metropolitanus TaxID=2943436 RepID=UPI002446151C|nr:uncharacterized protein LOC129581315 isoform X2 [Paramacrobiotus metropolitanus]
MSTIKDRIRDYRGFRASVKTSDNTPASNQAGEETVIEVQTGSDGIADRTMEWFLTRVEIVIDITNAIDTNIRALKEIFTTITGTGRTANSSAVAHLAYSLCVIPFHHTFQSLPFPTLVHEVKKHCEIVKEKLQEIAPDIPSLYTWSSTSTENKICNFHYIRMVNKLAEVMAVCAEAQKQYEEWQRATFPDMDKEVGCPLIEPHQETELSNSRDIDMTQFYKRDSDKAEIDLREIRDLMADIAYYTETIEKQVNSWQNLSKYSKNKPTTRPKPRGLPFRFLTKL